MSLNVALNTAVAGLRVAQAGTEVVSANIANAHDPNYTRKTLLTSTLVAGGSGQPTLVGIERQVALTMQQDLRGLTATRHGAELRQAFAEQIGQLLDLGGSEPRLGRMQNELETAFRDLAATPESDALAWQVVQKADSMATEIRKVAEEIGKLEDTARRDTGRAVEALNERLAEVARLNHEIRSRQGSGEPLGDLQDRRDAAIDSVAELTDIRILAKSDGSVALYTRNGHQLLGHNFEAVGWDGDNILGSQGQVIDSAFQNGRIGSLLALRADDAAALAHPDSSVGTLAKLRAQIDTLAQNLADTVNAAYDAAPTAAGELATDFFVFGAPPSAANLQVNPALLDGSQRAKGAAGEAVAQAFVDERFAVAAGGLNLTDTTVGGLVNALLSRNASHLATQKDAASAAYQSQQALDSKFRGLVGVDVDREVAELVVLQNAYAANARVMQTVTQMMDTLIDMVR